MGEGGLAPLLSLRHLLNRLATWRVIQRRSAYLGSTHPNLNTLIHAAFCGGISKLLNAAADTW